MGYPVVFQIADVADILELAKTTVKNWTIGRPLRIEPSVRAGRGAGESNLYNLTDVFLMAIAAQLNRDGFRHSVIEEVLTAVRPKAGSLGKAFTHLLISSPGRQLHIKVIHRAQELPIPQTSEIGRYVLNLERLIDRVQLRVEELSTRRNQE